VFGHGYTYSSHPVACAVSLKVLEIYERDDIFDHAAYIGEYMQTQMQKFKDHPLVGEVRGKGMIGAIELVANKKTRQAFTDGSVGYFLTQACQDHGLIIRVVAGFSAAFCPPLIITIAQIDEIMSKFSKGLDDTLAYVVNKGLLVAD
jgi:4-aminobutyrate--pyruvate transaminase